MAPSRLTKLSIENINAFSDPHTEPLTEDLDLGFDGGDILPDFLKISGTTTSLHQLKISCYSLLNYVEAQADSSTPETFDHLKPHISCKSEEMFSILDCIQGQLVLTIILESSLFLPSARVAEVSDCLQKFVRITNGSSRNIIQFIKPVITDFSTDGNTRKFDDLEVFFSCGSWEQLRSLVLKFESRSMGVRLALPESRDARGPY